MAVASNVPTVGSVITALINVLRIVETVFVAERLASVLCVHRLGLDPPVPALVTVTALGAIPMEFVKVVSPDTMAKNV